MLSIRRSFFAYLDELTLITILLPYSYCEGESSKFVLVDNQNRMELPIQSKEKMQHFVKYSCRIKEPIQLGKRFEIEDENNGKTDLQIGAVIRTKAFDDMYYYDGPLGLEYTNTSIKTFLWAPTAQQVKLVINAPKAPEKERRVIDMCRQDKGVWSVEVNENLEGHYYSFLVLVNLEWSEVMDPYCVAVSVNGSFGVIVDLNKTKVQKPVLPPLKNTVDSIIYETHIRDFTIHPESGVQDKGKYKGVTELNTRTKKEQLSGLSYMKDLGITHVEFLPVHDFEEVDELEVLKQYNWGYNPSHFNVPEGSYSCDPTEPYRRINELKEMIQTVQEQGIRVILDVVYNHVYKKEASSFEKIVPGYYFRYNQYGMPSNGTGVGNDIASERAMVRRFILDSIRFWLEEYQVDGFRFDLMGILDVTTMQQIRKLCDDRNENIILIGEGWDLATPLQLQEKATIMNQKELDGIGQFNDQFRDKVKGSTFQLHDIGVAFGNLQYLHDLRELLSGSIGLYHEKGMFNNPNKSVNYVESHDNHTLWDKIEICFPEETNEKKQKMHRLASAIVLISQGVPFLHSGQEFFRTKYGIENSYQSPDPINQMDWNRKDQFIENVQFIKNLITLRKRTKAFRLSTVDEIVKHVTIDVLPNSILEYQLQDIGELGKWETIIVYINVQHHEEEIEIPESGWKLLVSDDEIYDDHYPFIEGKQKWKIPPISFMMIGK